MDYKWVYNFTILLGFGEFGLYKDKDIAFVGIAIWDEESKVRQHIDTFGVNYPNAIDFQGKAAIAYGVRGVPEKFFLDRQGRIVKKYVGPISNQTLSNMTKSSSYASCVCLQANIHWPS